MDLVSNISQILEEYAKNLRKLESHQLLAEYKYQYAYYINLWQQSADAMELPILFDPLTNNDRLLAAQYLPLIVKELERRLIP